MTYQKNDLVLLDTNVIIEAHRIGCLVPIADYFNLHTVEKVIEETQTGYQNRREEQLIDLKQLRLHFSHIQNITEEQRLDFNIAHNHPVLDDGELDLLIYANSLADTIWLLNSPDAAAVRFADGKGWAEKVVSLESMLNHLRVRTSAPTRRNFTEAWLSEYKVRLQLGVM